ncbi:MAG: DNA mismatch repair protein MutS [Flavobacteriaceae bacterium]|nr:DNA mismatch repair protein MutS [Flavobacteriaceae bacterium]
MSANQKFKTGDKVTFLDEAIKGVVTETDQFKIVVLSDDGFLYTCEAGDLIFTGNMEALLTNSVEKIVEDKNHFKTQKVKKAAAKKIPAMEVDLHIEKLVDHFFGLQNHQILDIQLQHAKGKLSFAQKKKIRKVVFIHGLGEGVLRYELLRLFQDYNVEYCEASYQKYGLGATEVTFLSF